MNRRNFPLIIGVLLLFATACNKDEETADEVTIADFEGSWTATSAIFTNNSNSEQVIDIIALGGEIRFTAFDDGRTRNWVVFGDFSDEWDALVTLSGDILTSTPAEDNRPVNTYTYTLDGNTLTLSNEDDVFDFPGVGEVSVTSLTVLVRNN